MPISIIMHVKDAATPPVASASLCTLESAVLMHVHTDERSLSRTIPEKETTPEVG
jgi:hypothetical protein